MDEEVKAKALGECDFIIMHIDELQQKGQDVGQLKQALTDIRRQFEQGIIDWAETKNSMLEEMKKAEASDELDFIQDFLQKLDIKAMTQHEQLLENIGAFIVSNPITSYIAQTLFNMIEAINPSPEPEPEPEPKVIKPFHDADQSVLPPPGKAPKTKPKKEYIEVIHNMMDKLDKEVWELYKQGEFKAAKQLNHLCSNLNQLGAQLYGIDDFNESRFLQNFSYYIENTLNKPEVQNAHGFHLWETLQNIVDFIKSCLKGDKVVHYTYHEKRAAEQQQGSEAYQAVKSMKQKVESFRKDDQDEQPEQEKPGPSSSNR